MKTPRGEINDGLLAIVKDEALMTKMSQCTSDVACYDLVKEKVEISFEEFKSGMIIANDFLKEHESGLLSDDDLDQVAGGKSDLECVAAGLTTGATVGGAFAAAAAA